MRRKEALYYILGALISVIVFWGAIELTTRTVSLFMGKGFFLSLHELDPYDKRIESIYKWHPFTGIIFRPNHRFIGSHPYSDSKVLHLIDQHGFLAKDQSLKYEKPANEIRIATIGGSTTANTQLSFDENWPGYLGMLVQKALPHRNIRVINAAVPGFDTSQSIVNLSLRVIPFKPDIVIIYHAYNDLKAIRVSKKFKPDYSHLHMQPYGYHKKPNVVIRFLNRNMFYVRTRNQYREYEERKRKYEEIVNIKRSKGRISNIPQRAICTFEQHMKCLVFIAKSEGADVILSSFATLHDPDLDWSNSKVFKHLSELQKRDLYSLMHFTPGLSLPAIFHGFNRYNEVLRKVANQEEIGWVDNALLIPHKDKYFFDRVHFSIEGSKLMAKNFLPIVLKMLRHKISNRENPLHSQATHR